MNERLALEGRVVVVTGAARGLGRAHARTLAERGARVVVNDMSGAPECAERLRADGLDVVGESSDLSDWGGARALVANTLARFGALDGLVNNAGVLRRADVADLRDDDLSLELAVNLKATIACTRHASEYWRDEQRAGRRRSASVVNTTSDTIFTGSPGGSGYAATKAAIVAFTQSASLEGRQYGVRHNAVAPSGRTEMAMGSGLLGANPLREVPAPEDQDLKAPDNPLHNSPLIAWLISEHSSPVTGQVFRMRFGAFSRMEPISHGAWFAPPTGSMAWPVDDLSEVMAEGVFGSAFPAPMRAVPDGPSTPFARLDHT